MMRDDPDRLTCCYCSVDRFRSRQALADHEDVHRLAELAARPADPHMVLREAMVWAEDAGAFNAFDDRERRLFDVTRLAPGRPIPGYPASLFGKFDELSIRVAIADRASGPMLVVHLLYRDGTSIKLRRALPLEFHLTPSSPALRDTTEIAREFEAAVEAGLQAEREAA